MVIIGKAGLLITYQTHFYMKKIILFSVIVLLLISCKKDNDVGIYTVSGKISNIESGGSVVQVSLSNDQNNYITKPSASGDYAITNVKAGNYKLTVSQDKSKGSVERTKNVTISGSSQSVNVLLPDPVQIFCTDHPPTSVTLKWTVSADSGYREYKVYRGVTSGLDETTGTLMHVTTVRTDTVFVDSGTAMNSVSPNTDYYYRVFVTDDMGKIAGSNVLHVKTDNYPELYTLTGLNNFSASVDLGVIAGVAFDGNYLWLAYRLDIGGFYDNDKVTLAKYDPATFNLVDTISFSDRYEPLGGLTYDGQHLWLQYSASGTGSNFIREVDPVTKKIITSYSTDYGISGLAYFNNLLYLNYDYSKIETLNPISGAVTGSYNIPLAPLSGNSYGIAVRTNEIWVSVRLGGTIFVLNNNFTLKCMVPNALDYSQLCFMNDKLVVATLTRVYLFDITGGKSHPGNK